MAAAAKLPVLLSLPPATVAQPGRGFPSTTGGKMPGSGQSTAGATSRERRLPGCQPLCLDMRWVTRAPRGLGSREVGPESDILHRRAEDLWCGRGCSEEAEHQRSHPITTPSPAGHCAPGCVSRTMTSHHVSPRAPAGLSLSRGALLQGLHLSLRLSFLRT